jgi:hypothetical protein
MSRPILTGHLRDHAADGYVPVSLAAELVERPTQTVRNWASANDVSTRQAKDGTRLVYWPDVRDRSQKAERRKNVRTAAASA